MNISIKKYFLYAVLIGYALFVMTIRGMADHMQSPTLLPIKLELLYFGLLSVGILLLFIKEKKYRKENKKDEKDNRKIRNGNVHELGFMVAGMVVLVTAFAYSQQYYAEDIIRQLADVNSVRLTGFLTEDSTAMMAYYFHQLAGIEPVVSIGFLLPLCFYCLVGLLLYETALAFWNEDKKKAKLMFFTEALLLMIGQQKLLFGKLVFYVLPQEKAVALVFLPMLMFLLVFRLFCKTEKYDFTPAFVVEIVLLVGLSLTIYKEVVFLCVIAVTAGIMCGVLKKYRKSGKNSVLFFLVFYFLFDLFFLFNPWTRNNVIDLWYKKEEYRLLFLSLPIIPACSYCISAVPGWIKEKNKTAGIIMTVFMLFLGVAVVLETDWNARKKSEGMIPQPYQEIIAEIPLESNVKVLAPDEILACLRAQSTEINLIYEVNLIQSDDAEEYYDSGICSLHHSMQDIRNRLGQIVRIAEGNQCNYLVIPLDTDERWEMEQGGYIVLKETDEFVLYYYPVL